MATPEQFFNLGVSLALGLLIGTERGWEQRAEKEGSRIAGIRTFGLIGLIGGMIALLGRQIGPHFLVVGLAGFAFVLAAVIIRDTPTHTGRGATTIFAVMATFLVGAIAGWGEAPLIAVALAAIITILLGMKQRLHSWLATIGADEMSAAFKLLLISAVVLPLLPNVNYGPWGSLNPYEIWWLVVLISVISFVGFVAIKTISPQRGILLTSIFGGLASSTAIAVSFSKLGSDNPGLQRMLAAGVIISSTLMALRIIIVTSVVSPDLTLYLAPTLILMILAGVASAALLFRDDETAPGLQQTPISAAFNLSVPIRFGVIFAVTLVAVAAVRQWYGDRGLYGVAALAGLTDVNAITLSLARNMAVGLSIDVAGRAVIIASLANTLVKFAIVAVLCGNGMARRVGLGFGAMALAGVAGIIYGNFGIDINLEAFRQ